MTVPYYYGNYQSFVKFLSKPERKYPNPRKISHLHLCRQKTNGLNSLLLAPLNKLKHCLPIYSSIGVTMAKKSEQWQEGRNTACCLTNGT